ncbi:unnamed protein product [Lactuca saligna]|uniref:Uncharacterized protein n=1 Tax=Lactuca saligna TaxID=75948 RepID=A0AA35YF00_LACSI|nr:unnamed protein product [Lactuca saligna]
MLTWMKQQDPEFFSDISSFLDSIMTLLDPLVDNAPRDMSYGISDSSCTSPVTHVPISEGFVCFFGRNSTPNASEVESFPWAIQNTNLHFLINSTSPNSLVHCLQLSVIVSRQHGWNSTSPLDLSDDSHDCHDTELERDSKTPPPFLIPPSSLPPPPLTLGIDVKHRGHNDGVQKDLLAENDYV